MRIAEILPLENHMLYVKAEDGKAGLFNVAPFLESEVFAPLKDGAEFAKIHNGSYFVAWACGADLSADTIEARWQPLDDVTAGQGVSENLLREVSLAPGRF